MTTPTDPIAGALSALSAMSSPVSSLDSGIGTMEEFAQFLAASRAKNRIRPVVTAFPAKKKKGSPSILSRVIDVLSRPLYTVTSTINEAIDPKSSDPEDFLTAAWQGLAGKRKTMPIDIIASGRQRIHGETKQEAYEQIGKSNPVTQFMANLGPAIALDPLTYVGPGLFTRFKKPTPTSVEMGAGAAKSDIAAKALPALNDPFTNRAMPFFSKYSAQPADNLGELLSRKAASSGSSPAAAVNMQDIPASLRAAPSIPDIVPPVSTLDIPRPASPPVSMQSIIPSMQQAERAGQFSRMAEPPKIQRASELNVGEQLARDADYANLASAQRQGRAQAARPVPPAESPYAAAMRRNNPRTAAGVMLPRQADELIAGIARGDMNFIAAAAPKFVPTAKQAVNAEHTTKATELLSAKGIVGDTGQAKPFNRVAQENLRQTAYTAIKRSNPKISNDAARMYAYNVLRAAEQMDGVAVAGYGGKAGTTMSQMINDLGGPNSPLLQGPRNHLTQIARAFDTGDLKILDNAPVELRNAVQAAMARNAVAEAPSLARIVNSAAHDMDIARSAMSPRKFDDFVNKNIIKEIAENQRSAKVGLRPKNLTGAASQSPTTYQAARQLVSAANRARKSKPQEALDLWIKDGWLNRVRDGKSLYNVKPQQWAELMENQSRVIERELGVNFRNLGEEVGASNKAWDTIMARVSTHHGQADIRRLFQEEFAHGQAQAAAKAAYLNDLVVGNPKKGIPASTEVQRSEAFRVVQGMSAGPVSPEIQALAGRLEQLMGIMVDSKGMNSIATRAMVSMKQMNAALAQMGENFRFTAGKDVKDMVGNSHNFSKGMDWLDSWKIANISDPTAFMYKLDNAMEMVSHQNAAIDDFIARWGSAKYGSGYTYKVPSVERANGFFFPKDMAQQLANFAKSQEKLFATSSPFIKQLDKVLTAWKSGVTIYAPSHHIRNMIGDTYFNWMDGVNTFKPYRDAARIMGANKGKYSDLPGLETLSLDNPLGVAAQTTRPRDTILRTKGGLNLTAEQLYLGAFSKGLLQKAHVSEELIGDPLLKRGLPLIRGRGREAARSVSATRDHYVRLAHFADIMRKSPVSDLKGLDDAMSKAAVRVRKWHPDGMDLTHAEKTVARRLIPFYSWARKSIPLIVESVVKNPGKTLAYPKAMYALSASLGMNPESLSNPFPNDQLFPEWIKAKGVGPIALYGAGGLSGSLAGLTAGAPEFQFDPNTGNIVTGPMGYGVINPSNPFLDFFGTYGANPDNPVKGAFQGVLQGLTPFVKVPIELTQGRQFLTGAPIDDGSRYTTENLPLVSIISRLTGKDITGDPTRRADRGDINYQTEAWINFLTALGATGTGPYIKNTEIKQKVK